MVFSSYLFLFFFLPTVLACYYAVPRKWKHLVLTLFSYLFYGWANPYFCLLMLFNTTVDYTNGRLMERFPARKKLFVTLSIVCDLAILGFFKYFNFGVENYNALMSAMGIPEAQFTGFFRIVLPLGISFYTFQSMSYVIDVYRGDAAVVRNSIDYALMEKSDNVWVLPVKFEWDDLGTWDSFYGFAFSSTMPAMYPCFPSWLPGRSSGFRKSPISCGAGL